MVYDAIGQLHSENINDDPVTFTYDSTGNLLTKETVDGITTYTYTPVNRTSDEYQVIRETEEGETSYLWDNNNILQEYDTVTEAQYNYQPETYGNLISQHREEESSYYHYDGNFSTSALTDQTQTETDRYKYTAWGETVAETGSTENPFTWKGEVGYVFDEATGLFTLRRRQYQPKMGRFISEDPIGLESGVSILFIYSENNPTNLLDPTGLYVFYPPFEEITDDLYPPGFWDATIPFLRDPSNIMCPVPEESYLNPPFPEIPANPAPDPKPTPCIPCSESDLARTTPQDFSAPEVKKLTNEMKAKLKCDLKFVVGDCGFGPGSGRTCLNIEKIGRRVKKTVHICMSPDIPYCDFLGLLVHEYCHAKSLCNMRNAKLREEEDGGWRPEKRDCITEETKAYRAQKEKLLEIECADPKDPKRGSKIKAFIARGLQFSCGQIMKPGAVTKTCKDIYEYE